MIKLKNGVKLKKGITIKKQSPIKIKYLPRTFTRFARKIDLKDFLS